MGKIEDCFGTLEAGEAFALSAFEHPILRVVVEDIPRGSGPGDVRIQAIAGIATAAELTVPPTEEFKHPGIHIEPASIASIVVPRKVLLMGKTNGCWPSIESQEATALLVINPVQTIEEISTVVTAVIAAKRGSLTISRTPLVRTAMRGLDRLQDTDPYARIMYDMSKIALSNIWK